MRAGDRGRTGDVQLGKLIDDGPEDHGAVLTTSPGYRAYSHPGIFVTDSSAVPTSLCVNPSLTIAALAERASSMLLARAAEYGVAIARRVSPPGTPGPRRGRSC